jgi:hypothetical protein
MLLGTQLAVADVEFNADVMPLINANCVTCHATDGVSFSFEDPDETYNFRMAIALAVKDDRMPPWLAEPGHQSYVDDYSLTTDEKSLIAEWAAGGYQRAESVPVVAATEINGTFDADWSVPALAGESYLPNQDRKDDYRCFIVDWPYDTDKYVTGFLAEPGNMKIAHHLVAHMIGPESVDLLKTLSEEEEGPGHQCFGGALPDRFDDDEVQQQVEERFPGGWDKLVDESYWLSHWAPGMYGIDFPKDTGILMRPGSAVVVQMHYYSAFAPGEYDENTMMHFKVADSVKKPSVNHPLTRNRWLYAEDNDSMTIPPRESATYETSVRFDELADYMASALEIDREEISAIELQSANIHMHAFGASGVASLLDREGSKETLLSIPRWDLAWQRDFTFTEGKIIPRSEFDRTRLIVECTFNNYTDELVYGGYGSDDEMCFNFSYMSVIRGDDEALASSR